MNTQAQSTLIQQKDFHANALLARLLELHQIPEHIFIQGELPSFTVDAYGNLTPRILTIVGSRKNTNYGKDTLHTLVASLRGYPVIIVSGLALGIDALAHKQAIDNNLKTIAIPGSGLGKNTLYPRTNYMLAQEILANEGLLISELPDTQKAATWTFPARNRLMAALSDAVLIIEAEDPSGTLITARQALELGKDIGVIPGSIFSLTSKGTNMLLREGAYPITNQDDLLALLNLSKQETLTETQPKILYSEEEQKILTLLKEPCSKEVLQQRTAMGTKEFLVTFSKLELAGLISESLGEVRRLV